MIQSMYYNHNGIRNQQNKMFEKIINAEIKHIPKLPVVQSRNHKGNQRIFFEMGENKNTIYKNLLVDSKAVLKGIDYVEKQKKRSQINNVTFYFKKLEVEQTKLKSSRINKLVNISIEVNKIILKILKKR